MKMLIKTIFSIVTALALLPVAALAGHHEGGDHAVAAEQMGDDVVWASGARAVVAEVEGEVIAVDMETREVVVRGPAGNFVTLSAREDGVDLSKIVPGDTIIADYVASIEAEVRAPTDEEEANPWIVLGEMGRTADDADMTAAGGKIDSRGLHD
jgi:hypothetical protein